VRLPKGPVREVLNDMARTWAELDHLEKRNGLSFLREPDSGFVWAAYRWVRGAKLEDVLDSVPGLTPGDFVRSMKQLIDLLDQIAVASRDDTPGARASRSAGAGKSGADAARAATSAPDEAGAAGPDPEETRTPGSDTAENRTAAAETDAGEAGDSDPGADTGGSAAGRPSREPAPRSRDVAATARAAIDAMRHGVIAYTTLAD
jgi:hypothetical protein